MTDVFPRGTAMPTQSPLFWVDRKDRILRQLLIADIEAVTGRRLVVMYADLMRIDAQIDAEDGQYLLEVLHDVPAGPVDFMLETSGGMTDATEKLVSILLSKGADLRVIVPCAAKSNGTLLALAGREIMMGPGSELGPVDPFLRTEGPAFTSTNTILERPESGRNWDEHSRARHAQEQTRCLARQLLSNGMMSGRTPEEVDATVMSLVNGSVYHSHGSVIDAREAQRLGLTVDFREPDEPLWQKLWLLRCCYMADVRTQNWLKIFEGARVSYAIEAV